MVGVQVNPTLQGYRVGVVDTDLPSPGIHNLFNLELLQTQKTLNHYLWGESSIIEVTHDLSEILIPDSQGKLFFVPSSIKPDDIARVLQNGYNVKVMNQGFKELVKEFKLDYLFIDTYPGLSKETFLSIAISLLLILILRPDKQDYQGTAVTIAFVFGLALEDNGREYVNSRVGVEPTGEAFNAIVLA